MDFPLSFVPLIISPTDSIYHFLEVEVVSSFQPFCCIHFFLSGKKWVLVFQQFITLFSFFYFLLKQHLCKCNTKFHAFPHVLELKLRKEFCFRPFYWCWTHKQWKWTLHRKANETLNHTEEVRQCIKNISTIITMTRLWPHNKQKKTIHEGRKLQHSTPRASSFQDVSPHKAGKCFAQNFLL